MILKGLPRDMPFNVRGGDVKRIRCPEESSGDDEWTPMRRPIIVSNGTVSTDDEAHAVDAQAATALDGMFSDDDTGINIL